MTGGILQLVAKGVDDLFLMGDPEITFFKTVYRRHTNFSTKNINLRFASRMDFGRNGSCRLAPRGDLLHRLLLRLEIPEIDLRYKRITRKEVYHLLKSHRIDWPAGASEQNQLVTSGEVDEISDLIDDKVQELQDQIEDFELTLTTINEYHDDNSGESSSDYNMGLIQALLESNDQYIEIYNAIKEFGSNYDHKNLSNSDQIKQFMLKQFKEYIFDDPDIVNLIDKQIFIDNYRLYDNILRTNLLVTKDLEGVISNVTYFQQILKDLYVADEDDEYQDLDAYKIFNNYLIDNEQNITINSDVEVLRSSIANNINWGIGKNIQLMMRLYDNFTNDYRFIFYKRMQYDTVTATYSTGEPFLNVSTLTTTIFDDNFTKNMNILDNTNQPEGISHSYSKYVTDKVTNYHLENRGYFREESFKGYFSDRDLWKGLEIGNFIEITNTTTRTLLSNVYLLNFLPVAIVSDIQILMGNLIPNLDANEFNTDRLNLFFNSHIGIYDSNDDHIEDFKDAITTVLCGEDCMLVSAEDLSALEDLAKAYKNINDDVLVTAVFKKYSNLDPEDGGGETNMIDYVIRKWLAKVAEEVEAFNDDDANADNQMTEEDHQVFKDIINTYVTEKEQIPSYEVYKNKYNLFEINLTADETQFIENPLNISNSLVRYLDTSCSIWKDLYLKMIDRYNSLFNDEIFEKSYVEDSLGKSALEHITEIENNQLDLTEDVDGDTVVLQEYSYGDNINYYNLNADAIANVNAYLDTQRASYVRMNQRYENNKKILEMVSIKIPRISNYYGKVETITELIENGIESIYGDETAPEIVADTVDLVREGGETYRGEEMDSLIAPGDFLDELRADETVVEAFGANPEETDIYQNTLGLTAEELYNDLSIIVSRYNDLANTSDVINYLLYRIVRASTVATQDYLKNDNESTYAAVTEYFTGMKTEKEQKLAMIYTEESEILKETVQAANKSGQMAKFAWTDDLGHSLIKRYRLYIGGQLVETGNGEWLRLRQQLRRRTGQETGYKKMIGDVKELTTFDNTPKGSRVLYVPLPFWFTEDSGASLPLVSLSHTEVLLEVELAPLHEVAYWEPLTYFRKRPKLVTNLIGEYVFLENEERIRISKMKHEYLITQIQTDSGIEIGAEMIGDDYLFQYQLYFENLGKELIWIFQEKNKVDGSALNGEYLWTDYLYTIDGVDYQMYETMELQFNQRWRDEGRPASYYNYLVPHKVHGATPADGVGVYSFALHPDQLQPSGAANFSRLDNVTMIFKMNPTVVEDMRSTGKRIKLRVYMPGYNILRVMSGMAGLAFFG